MLAIKKLPEKGCGVCKAAAETKCFLCKKTYRQWGPLGEKNRSLMTMWKSIKAWGGKTSGDLATDQVLIILFGAF